ncbi:MAG: flagellar basal body-associated FliL family protein, partial [Acidobacteriota bacterium]
MADEKKADNETPETGAETEENTETPKKKGGGLKSKLGFFLMIAVAAAFGGSVSLAGMMFLGGGAAPAAAPAPAHGDGGEGGHGDVHGEGGEGHGEADAHGGEHGGEHAEVPYDDHGPGASELLNLEPFVVNMADTDRERYLKTVIKIEFANDKLLAQVRDQPGNLARVRHAIIMVLTTKTVPEVKTNAQKEELRKELRLV